MHPLPHLVQYSKIMIRKPRWCNPLLLYEFPRWLSISALLGDSLVVRILKIKLLVFAGLKKQWTRCICLIVHDGTENVLLGRISLVVFSPKVFE